MLSIETLLNSGQPIEVNNAIATKEYQDQKEVLELFDDAVEDIALILEAKNKPIMHVPTSMGKDSLLVLLLTIQAYATLIKQGRIEASRPLIATTVDTAVEAVPMQMMVRYSAPRLREFAENLGVNLQYTVLKPRFIDEFFIRWGSAQKLIPNPTKSGDCSIILKVDVSTRHLRSLSSEMDSLGYGDSPIISLLGSRDSESARRKQNIEKANLRTNPLEAMNAVNLGRGSVIYQYAPISHWTDEQVFLYHKLAGGNPVTKSLLGNKTPLFNTFFPSHGLTLAIYGNGKNESCSVVVGQTNNATCGGKNARFGCYICPMTGSIDRSSEALAQYPRWASLGGDKALAVRDWIFRLSTSSKARAFHAKAIDEVGFNRIALQGNVLKAKYLEKMVWHASALSVESKQKADHFKSLVSQGREMEHVGMQDIANDDSLTSSVKRQFLEMYKEVAQTPLYECFSERHALLLSFRWLADGVATTSFKPISIYQRVLNGERLATPMTNREYESKFGKISMANHVADPVMISFHTKKFEKSFHPLHSPRFLSYWQRPSNALDLFDKDMNCSIEDKPQQALSVEFIASCNISESGDYLPSFDKPKVNGRLLPKLAQAMIEPHILEHLKQYYADRALNMYHCPFYEIKATFEQDKTHKMVIPHLVMKKIGFQLNNSEAQVKAYNEKTERVIVRKNGKITRTTTRMNFYPPKGVPSNLINKYQFIYSLGLNFALEEQFKLSVAEEGEWQDNSDLNLENLTIDAKTFGQWLSIGGWEKAIAEHDEELQRNLERSKANRGKGFIKRQVRTYGGSGGAHELLQTSGIAIASKYVPQLLKTLKRTDLFSNIGVFDYAALSHEMLLSLSNIIPMSQHRKDKISCVNAIRKERNKVRAQYKALQVGEIASVLEQHFEQSHEHLVEIDKALHFELGGYIDTAEPPTPRRMASSRMLLGMTSVNLSSPEMCMKSIYSAVTMDRIKADPKNLFAMTQAYRHELVSLQAHIQSVTDKWTMKNAELKALNHQLKFSELDHNDLWLAFQDKHNDYAKAQVTYYPHWRARRETKIDRINRKIAFISKVQAELDSLQVLISKSLQSTGSHTVKSLNTKDKLNFLAFVA